MNPQETYWSGPQGSAYQTRQSLPLANRKAMFSRIMASALGVKSVIEFGAGRGENLQALRQIMPFLNLTGVEINNAAFLELKKVADLAFHGSVIEFPSSGEWDMAMTRGLLIHIPPEELQRAYKSLYQAAKKYICIAEYHSPRFEEIPYHGEMGKLWKGPYAEQMLDRFPDLKVRDYGFIWSRDPLYPQGDVSWFLLEKANGH